MYRLAICDDEAVFLANTEAMVAAVLREAGIACQIECFSSADVLSSRLLAQPGAFDVLVLDIVMREQNGVVLARTIRDAGYQGSILFVTSSKDFALEGYSVQPIDYLLKPLEKNSLRDVLLRDYQKNHRRSVVTIPAKGGSATVLVDGILYAESMNRTMIFHTNEGNIVAGMTLKEAQELLARGDFFQCHKSFLVHIAHIRDIRRTEVILRNGEKLPIGRVYASGLLSAFIEYMQAS